MPEPPPSITSITICRPIFKKSKNVPGVLRMIWRNDIWMLQENKEPLYKFLFYISSKYIITFWQAFNDAFSSYIITMSPSFNSSKIRANSSQDTS